MSTTERLRGLQQRLQDLGALPPRLRGFHDRRLGLLHEVEAQAQRLAWMIRGRDLQALETRAAALARLASELSVLTDEAESLSIRLRGLRDTAGQVRDSRLGAWFLERAQALADELAGTGEATVAAEALPAERRRLKTVLDALPDLERALDLYREAEDWLQRLQAETRRAALSADLPVLSQRLLTEGVGADWIAALQSLLEPVKDFANRPQPPGLQELGGRIQGLLQWRAALGEPCPECDGLAQEFTRKRQDWTNQDEDTFEVLRVRTAVLEGRLQQLAAERQHLALAEIDAQRSLLRDVGVQDAPLEQRWTELRQTTPADAEGFAAWRDNCTQAQEDFRSVVSNNSQVLVTSYADMAKTCRERAARLAERPRLDAADRRLRDLALELKQMEAIPDGAELLNGIGTLRELGARLDTLEQDINQDWTVLEARRTAVAARCADLTKLAQRVGQPPPGLTELAATGSVRLEQMLAQADVQDQGLDTLEADLLATGVARLAARHGRAAEIQRLLGAIPILGLGDLSEIAPPQLRSATGLSLALDRAQASLETAETGLEQALIHLQQQREDLLQRAAAIDADRLGPLQARQISEQRHLLAQWQLSADIDPLDQARRLHGLGLAMRQVLQPVELTQSRVRSLRKTLGERLRRLNLCTPVPEFPEACTEWAQRIEALIAPTDQVVRPIRAESAQLDEAARLLGALEDHCRRLAAVQDAADITQLRGLRRRPTDPQAEALLQRLAALPRHEPPPDALRLDLHDLIAARMETQAHDL